MAKLILSLDNAILSEHPLNKERITIGRRPTNDIHLDHLEVTGEHAAILQLGNDFYVEDLNSTNGTAVNSKLTKKHLLQHADLIGLGRYQLTYINDAVYSDAGMDGGKAGFEKTVMIRPPAMKPTPTPADQMAKPPEAASAAKVSEAVQTKASLKAAPSTDNKAIGKILVLNGASSGRELVLNKALTTLGKVGVQVAVITRRPGGYFITHVEGPVFPIVNGASTGAQAFALSNHDVIELVGVKMEFYLGKS